MPVIYILLGLGLILVFSSLLTVTQGTIAVITLFGKYQRILTPGLRMKIPILEKVYRRISIQNQNQLNEAFDLLLHNEDERLEKGHICSTFVQMNKGATQTIMNHILD